MSYLVQLDPREFIIIAIHRDVDVDDYMKVLKAVRDLTERLGLPILLDFQAMKEDLDDVFQWVRFIQRLRLGFNQRIALVHYAVGHATVCNLVALTSDREGALVRAFHSKAKAGEWLIAS